MPRSSLLDPDVPMKRCIRLSMFLAFAFAHVDVIVADEREWLEGSWFSNCCGSDQHRSTNFSGFD
jgi:hypothetical protein